MRVHRRTDPDPGRPGPVAEPHRGRVAELLRPVLPVGDVCPSSCASAAYVTRWAGMEYRRMRPFGKARGWTSALAVWPVRVPGRVLGPWPSRDHGTFPIKTSRERSAPPTNYRCETVRNPLTLNRSSS